MIQISNFAGVAFVVGLVAFVLVIALNERSLERLVDRFIAWRRKPVVIRIALFEIPEDSSNVRL